MDVEIKKEGHGPFAVWACGAAASGKSRVCEPALLPLGFRLMDVDDTYENLLRQYDFDSDIPDIGKEEREQFQAEFTARWTAVEMIYKTDSDGSIDLQGFLRELEKKVRQGKLKPGYVGQLARKIRDKWGLRPVPGQTFLKTIFPEMEDWEDPLDFLEERQPVTPTKLLTVSKEITRRRIDAARNEGLNLLVVETGGLMGPLVDTKEALEEKGYETFLLWIFLDSVEDALKRNEKRRAAGGRGLSERIVRRSFEMTRLTRELLLKEFAPRTAEIDNTPEGDRHIRARIKEVRSIIQRWMGE